MKPIQCGTVALAVGVAGIALTVAPLHADTDKGADLDGYRMQLVLDSSGSMKEPAKGGTKIKAAKHALGSVIDDLPKSAQVGLRVYGATISSGKGACTDSQQVVEPSTDNRDELQGAVDDYAPLGETPIGYSLQEAAKDLGSEGKRTIVLVSDGESTCNPDPCKVAKSLSKDGIDLRIDVVGLSVDRKTRKQLSCIAEAGNGTYYDADDAESLTRSIDTVSTRAFRPFDLTGTPVTGSSEPSTAPTIATGEQYLDKLPVAGSKQFYRIERTVPGSTIHIGTTSRTTAGSIGNGVMMDINAENSDQVCGSGSSYGNGVGADRPLLAASVSTTKPYAEEECANADFFNLVVELNTGEELARTPFEIVVYEEPPLASGADKDLPPAVGEPEWSAMKPAKAENGLAPGTSLANASVIDDGTYALDIQSGETQVFAVPLDWGQRLQVQIDSDLPKAAYDNSGAWSGFEPTIYGPVRGEGSADTFSDEPPDWTTTAFGNMWTEDDKHWRVGAMTPEVRYLNRVSNDAAMPASALPGFRYVEVNLSLMKDGVTIPYELTVERFGKAGEGAPEYESTDEVPPLEADSAVTAIGESVEPGEAAGSQGDSTKSTESGESDDSDVALKSNSDSDLPILAILLGGAGLVVIAGGITAVALARRPR